ncbi:MAG TPA: DUF6036 family nucleotidyltransferase [Acidimicrobiales bacterium]|nr:DUF6036 family nucleotidyltransferase [Acidimicrobiales bacterium]
MNREDLAHILRSAAQIAGDNDILIIGSQAILGSFSEDELPDETYMSIEADVAFFDDPGGDKSDMVDGAIGEGSLFQTTHGIYGQGVSVETAVLPAGWRARLVPFVRPDALPSRALCLEPHDLVISKLVAGREKDFIFTGALLRAGRVSADLLRERADELEVLGAIRRRVIDDIGRLQRSS